MLKINKRIADELFDLNSIDIGIDINQDFVAGDSQFIVMYDNNEIYLNHISEYEFDGILVKLKENNG